MERRVGEEGEVVSPLGLIRCFEVKASVFFRPIADLCDQLLTTASSAPSTRPPGQKRQPKP